LGRRRVAVALMTLLLLKLLAEGRQVWGLTYTFSPDPPVAGQPFTITSSDPFDSIEVYSGSGCDFVNLIVLDGASVSVPAQPAGTYSFITSDIGPACPSFTVIPAPATSLPHAVAMYVGAAFLAHKNYCTASPTHC